MNEQLSDFLAKHRRTSSVELDKRRAELAHWLGVFVPPNPVRQMLYAEWLACDLILNERDECESDEREEM